MTREELNDLPIDQQCMDISRNSLQVIQGLCLKAKMSKWPRRLKELNECISLIRDRAKETQQELDALIGKKED